MVGAYGHGVFGALETLGAGESARFAGLRERLHVMRARRVLLAGGATERLIAFPGNDVPGVMLAGAALAYLRRYGVAAGRQPAFLLNNDEAYEAAFALGAAGVRVAAVIDPRANSLAAERARAQGIEVLAGAVVSAVRGRSAVRGVRVRLPGGAARWIAADALLVSGGFNPATALASQLGAKLSWREALAAFTAELSRRPGASRARPPGSSESLPPRAMAQPRARCWPQSSDPARRQRRRPPPYRKIRPRRRSRRSGKCGLRARHSSICRTT